MSATDQHHRLYCTRHVSGSDCGGVVAVVPHGMEDVQLERPLSHGEPSRPGFGTLWCPVCRCKWEVGPWATMGEVA